MTKPRRSRGRLAATATCALLAALALVPAGASADPPLGKFYCWTGGSYIGYLKLNARGGYSLNDRYRGTYAYRKASRVVIFRTGYLKEFYGAHRHEGSSTVVYLRVRGGTAGYRCARRA